MGRLLDALHAEIKTRVPATLATSATNGGKCRNVADVAKTLDSNLQRLLSILRAENLPDRFLGLDHGDLSSLSDSALHAYARMLGEDALRESGEVPPDETAQMFCAKCGPVWAAPEVAAVLPRVDGWPRALGCPWCHIRRIGLTVPRPPVACGDCGHFVRDHINPFAGAGRCGAEIEQDRMYPAALHRCHAFKPQTKREIKNIAGSTG